MPTDVQPSATAAPVGIVCAMDSCFTNAVYGGPDNFSAAGNIVHALVVINGICAANNSHLPDRPTVPPDAYAGARDRFGMVAGQPQCNYQEPVTHQ